MQINITLTEDQQKSIVNEAMQTLTPRELANSLFASLVLKDKDFNSDVSQQLYMALADYLKAK